MAAEPDHAHCNCADARPGYSECSAMWVYGGGGCGLHCEGHESRAAKRQNTVAEKIALDARIDLDVHGASSANVGKLIADVTYAEIFVPADRIDSRRTLF